MKKLFALILAVAMLMSLSVTAFAAEVDQDAADKWGETLVSFDVAPTYIVTIPATVTLEKNDEEDVVTYENDYTITADAGVRLHKGDTIVVTITSDYEMTAQQGATLPYTVTHKNGDALTDSIVATFTTSTEAQSSTIHIAANDPEFAGEYQDTVTFTISVVKPAPTTISFTIDGVAYEADVGMTWAEWLESSYCGADFSDWGEGFVGNDAGYVVCLPNAADWWYDSVYIEDEIEKDFAYELLYCTGA